MLIPDDKHKDILKASDMFSRLPLLLYRPHLYQQSQVPQDGKVQDGERLCLVDDLKVYKDQFDSIKKIRDISKEHCDSLIAQLNSKSMENAVLKGQIQENIFVITTLKNELRKLKGKNMLDNAATITNATTIAPGMFKLDLDPLAPRLLKNRDAHIDYLKYTQDQADILQGIVEQAKTKQPLDNVLDFAYKHAKRIQ
ncbi:hypothetical protein Tco_0098780 [Tanacetum coccineum]